MTRHTAPVARLSLALALAGLLAVSAPAPSARADTPAPPPKLVVVVVLDQFPIDHLQRFAPYFGEGGFKWLMRNGAYLRNAHYSHATTYTGPGHATILSGSYGHVNGIIGNRWWNPVSNRMETMFFDPDAKIPGVELDPAEDDTSPRNFIGDNLGDQLLLSNNGKSKAFGVSLKDRAALMLAGKLGKAYWFHEDVGGIVSSTYYMPNVPAWVREFNGKKIPDAAFGKQWTRSLPEADYAISEPDNFPNEADVKDLGQTFPHTLTDKSGKPTPDYYKAFTDTPFAVDYELEFARQVIEKEGLGADDAPDILGVSISSTDYTGHAYGPNSQEVQDLVVRTDGLLAKFFADLNKKFKKGEWTVVLTADHGATPMPEYMKSKGFEASRIKKKQLQDAIDGALNAKYGPGDWILTLEDPGVYLKAATIAAKGLNPVEVQKVVGDAAMTVTGIATYFTREQFTHGGLPPSKWAQMFEKSYYPLRGADVILMTKPYYFWGTYGEKDTGSTHGSPYEYDTHVPLIFAGAGIKPGIYDFPADMADLTPTLALLLNVNAPAGAEGRPLHEILSKGR